MFIILSTPNRFNHDKIIILSFKLKRITEKPKIHIKNDLIIRFHHFEKCI